MASTDRLYSDLDSGEDDEDSQDSRNTTENTIHDDDNEADERKFFAVIFTTQRSEEDLAGYAGVFDRDPAVDRPIDEPTTNSELTSFSSGFSSRYHTFFKELGSLRSQLRAVESSCFNSENDQTSSLMTAKTDRLRALIRDLPLDWRRSNSRTLFTSEMRNVEENGSERECAMDQRAYCTLASNVRSVIGFVKVAYPDLIGGDATRKLEPLNVKDRKVCRAKLLTCVERSLRPAAIQEVVYDLDALAAEAATARTEPTNERQSLLDNSDETRVGVRGIDTKLHFESRFESGNLRKAIQVTRAHASERFT